MAGPSNRLAERVRGLAATSMIRNSFLMMASTGVNLALGFVFVFAATHRYSHGDFGLGSAMVAAMSLCSTIGSVGVGNALIQNLPKRDSGTAWSRTLCAGLGLAGGLGMVVGLPVVVALPILAPDFGPIRSNVAAALAFLVGIALLATSDMLDRAFVAERRSGGMLARNLAVSAIKVVLVLLPWFRHLGPWGVAGAWIAAPALVLPFSAMLLRRLDRGFRLVSRGVGAEARAIQSSLTGNHAVSIGNMAPQFLLPILVTALVSKEANGTFAATWRVGGAFMIVSVAVSTTLFAEISHDARGVERAVRRAATVIGAILAPAILVTLVLGRFILGLLGHDYEAGYGLLVLFLFGSIPDAVTNMAVAVLRNERRYRFAAVLTLGMATITLGLTAALLPWLGIAGAGWAWLVAQLAGSLLVAYEVRRRRAAPTLARNAFE